MVKIEILESALLLVLLLNLLRLNFLTNQLVLAVLATLFLVFLTISFLKVLGNNSFFKLRIWVFWAAIIVLYASIHVQNFEGKVHDGAILTEAATRGILLLKNPYSMDYHTAFESVSNKPADVVYNHYMYSPLTFIVNVPAQVIFGNIAGYTHFKITLMLFLATSALVASRIVKEKQLFLIIFLLNPVFVPLVSYGANEVLILFFILACFWALYVGRLSLATVMLSLATGTKLLALPFAPLYFLYLFIKYGKKLRLQLALFLVINALIYLPFALWNFRDLLDDIVFYHLRGGAESHVIAGFLGIPEVLKNLGVISAQSQFPFYLLQMIVGIAFIYIAYKILKKSATFFTLSMLYIFYFCVLLVFSRIIQTSYIVFLSQVLLFASFVKEKRI